jgi:hypothetical protein
LSCASLPSAFAKAPARQAASIACVARYSRNEYIPEFKIISACACRRPPTGDEWSRRSWPPDEHRSKPQRNAEENSHRKTQKNTVEAPLSGFVCGVFPVFVCVRLWRIPCVCPRTNTDLSHRKTQKNTVEAPLSVLVCVRLRRIPCVCLCSSAAYSLCSSVFVCGVFPVFVCVRLWRIPCVCRNQHGFKPLNNAEENSHRKTQKNTVEGPFICVCLCSSVAYSLCLSVFVCGLLVCVFCGPFVCVRLWR